MAGSIKDLAKYRFEKAEEQLVVAKSLLEDKNKEVQLTDEEIEEVSGGVAGPIETVVGKVRIPKKGITEEPLKKACFPE